MKSFSLVAILATFVCASPASSGFEPNSATPVESLIQETSEQLQEELKQDSPEAIAKEIEESLKLKDHFDSFADRFSAQRDRYTKLQVALQSQKDAGHLTKVEAMEL